MLKMLKNNEEFNIIGSSLSVRDTVESITDCSFSINQHLSDYKIFNKGEQISIINIEESNGKQTTRTMFAGYIYDVDEEIMAGGKVRTNIVCQGMEYVANKRVVIRAFFEQRIDTIVRLLHKEYLEAEGISIGALPVFEEYTTISFDFVKLKDALDQLAEEYGCIWYIDEQKKLYFHKKNQRIELQNILSLMDKRIISNIRFKRTNYKYRNKQYLRGCKGISNKEISFNLAENNGKTFNLGYPVMDTPQVFEMIGGQSAEFPVGRKGKDEENPIYNYFWEYESESIVMRKEHETTADTIIVKFKGGYEILVVAQNDEEIYKQAKIDCTTGLFENVEDGEFVGISASQKYANQIIKANSQQGYELEFDIITEQMPNLPATIHFRSGIIIRSSLYPLLEGYQNFLITERQILPIGETFIYRLKLVIGPLVENWTAFFEKKSKTSRIIQGGTQETPNIPVVTVPFSVQKTWLAEDNPNVFGKILLPSNTLLPSNDLYMGGSVETIAYVDATIDGQVYRVKQTDVERTETNINTIFFIPAEIGGKITNLKFYSGSKATENIGTGILLDEHIVDFNKGKYVEVIQLTHNSIKNF